MNFYSEFGEDKWIWENMELPREGFYVDVGCAAPGGGNNTEFLRQLQEPWSGLVIDANGSYRKQWENQPGNPEFVEAVIAAADEYYFWQYPDPGCSRAMTQDQVRAQVARKAEGQCVKRHPMRLDKLIKVSPVDLLSLDIEGGEHAALQTLSLTWYRPKIIIAEYRSQDTGIDYRAMEYLLETGQYFLVHQTYANLIFVRREFCRFATL